MSKKFPIQKLDFVSVYESDLRSFFRKPAYWNETQVEMSALGIQTAEVWEPFVGTRCGLAVWKMQC